jgi:hypothetical protein
VGVTHQNELNHSQEYSRFKVVAREGFEPPTPFWGVLAYETSEIGRTSLPRNVVGVVDQHHSQF